MKKKIFTILTAGVSTATVLISSMPVLKAEAAGTNLYVGYPGRDSNFNTVNEAVSAAAQINPRAENERVTIHIAPGTYREQITVTTPYLSFVNDTPSQKVLLTWYYGIGYKYYSVSSQGVYSAESASQRSVKNEPKERWGCSVRIRSNAPYFRAENISFENSFNRYVTSEELADGVEVSGSQNITFQRYAGADVQQKAATERAAAIAIEGNFSEFKNCSFQSSQDTLFLGSDYGYFKDCMIEGNTDYIFGSGTYVFDTCELRFKGYSSGSVGGYITANKNAGRTLFTDCNVTAGSLTVSPGYFGRPWGTEPDVAFVNTKLQYEGIITGAGWTKMSNNDPQNAKFKEYGTTANGRAVNTSQRVWGTVQNSANGLDPATYFGSWIPFYLGGESAIEVEPVRGECISALTPSLIGYAWEIRQNAQTGDPVFTDRDFTYVSLSDALRGSEMILTPCDAKKLSGTLAEATAGCDLTVYVLLDNRVEKLPTWLSGYTKTAYQAEISNDVTFDVYSMDVAKDETIVFGENGQSSYCVNYTAMVQKRETAPVPSLRGDADENGTLTAKDLTLIKQHLLDQRRLTDIALANADFNADGTVNAEDTQTLQEFLLGGSRYELHKVSLRDNQ